MAFYVLLTTNRTTRPDNIGMIASIRSSTGDPTAVLISQEAGKARGKKATAWTAGDITAAQNILDTAQAVTPQLAGQQAVDGYSIELRGLVLALIDETNRLRAALRGLGVTPLPDVTPAQALAAVRTKVGTL